ncbi:MAG: class I SAM-dependent methyltransferase [Parcubacteria group bacterium]
MIQKYSPPSPHILSVGCGPGIIEDKFPGKVQGLDKLIPDYALIPVAQGLLEQIPFDKNTYDVVFLGEILEHVYDTHQAISEVKRVLKTEGLLVLTVPNVMNLRDRIRALFGILPRHLSGYLKSDPHLLEHIRHFNKTSLQDLLESHDFEILEFSSSAININLLGSRPFDLYWIARFVPSLGNNLICAARLRN